MAENWTTEKTGEVTGIPPATLRYWRHKGEGPKSFKVGAKKVLYRREDVEAWMAEQYAASAK